MTFFFLFSIWAPSAVFLWFLLKVGVCFEASLVLSRQSHSRCAAFVLHYRLAAARHSELPKCFRGTMREWKLSPLIKFLVRILFLMTVEETESCILKKTFVFLLLVTSREEKLGIWCRNSGFIVSLVLLHTPGSHVQKKCRVLAQPQSPAVCEAQTVGLGSGTGPCRLFVPQSYQGHLKTNSLLRMCPLYLEGKQRHTKEVH